MDWLLVIYSFCRKPDTTDAALKIAGGFALGIAEESPQPDAGGARTCNGKPDPAVRRGNAQIKIWHVMCNTTLNSSPFTP